MSTSRSEFRTTRAWADEDGNTITENPLGTDDIKSVIVFEMEKLLFVTRSDGECVEVSITQSDVDALLALGCESGS